MAQKGFNGLSDEEYSKVQEAIKASGLNDREWITLVSQTYLMQQISMSPDYQKDIATIRQATTVMLDTVTNMIKRSVFEVEQLDKKSEADRAADQLIISQLKSKLAVVEEEKKSIQADMLRLEERVREAEGRTEAAERADAKNSLIIEGLQKQVKDLEEVIVQYKADHERVTVLEEERVALENEVHEWKAKFNAVSRDLEVVIARHENEITEKESQHSEELQLRLEKKELDHERELLRVQREYQMRIDALQAEHNEKIAVLYERIDQARNSVQKE